MTGNHAMKKGLKSSNLLTRHSQGMQDKELQLVETPLTPEEDELLDKLAVFLVDMVEEELLYEQSNG